jgi:hypothetical protein
MITFLASPKSFNGLINTIQRNAISSWKALHPEIEIILFGNEIGVAEYAKEMCLTHVPHVEETEFGTPYFNAITSYGARYGRHDIQAFINSDIMLVDDVLKAINNVPFRNYVITNFRVNLPEGISMDVTTPDWREKLFSLARENKLFMSTGSDIFLFKRGFFNNAPKLILGRAGVDNGICAYALRSGVPLIDATRSIMCLHPFHNYDHVSGGRKEIFEGKEKQINALTYGDWNPHVRDGGWIMINYRLIRTFGQGDWYRAITVYFIYRLNWFFLLKGLTTLFEYIRWVIPSPMHITTVQEALEHLGYKTE